MPWSPQLLPADESGSACALGCAVLGRVMLRRCHASQFAALAASADCGRVFLLGWMLETYRDRADVGAVYLSDPGFLAPGRIRSADAGRAAAAPGGGYTTCRGSASSLYSLDTAWRPDGEAGPPSSCSSPSSCQEAAPSSGAPPSCPPSWGSAPPLMPRGPVVSSPLPPAEAVGCCPLPRSGLPPCLMRRVAVALLEALPSGSGQASAADQMESRLWATPPGNVVRVVSCNV
mmetsp:Transcript_35904/g.79942  ORF Transcript_35904/g.79942 Transcript_35904/m.79942 type:complete len:232 (+) Transcript_35904:501-1196(+)